MTDKSQANAAANTDLDALLDDALNDFDADHVPETSGTASSSAGSSAQPAKASKGKGLAFDPLPRPKTKKSHASAAQASATSPFGGFGGGFGAIPPDIADQDELSAGFSRMMAELAHVDLTQGQQPLPRAEPAVPGDHDLAATLKALAANSSSFGGNQAAAPSSLDPDDIDPEMISRLSQQLNALTEEAGRVPGGQEGPADDMAGLVDGIMHQLLAKDVLYQPIQDIGARYPQWLEEHKQQLSPGNLERYTQQFQHIQDITQLYEQEPDNFPKLINLLQQMQACGEPPKEIVSEMAPGLMFDSDGQPQIPGGLGNALGGLGLPGLSAGPGGSEGACCIQ